MTSKANLKLFYVAIGLLAAAAIYQWLQQRQISQAASPRIVLFEGATSNTLTQISIVSPGTSDTLLTQRGGQWFVDADKGFRADVNLLSQVLTTLESPIEGDVVSTNPDSFSEYHLTSTSGTQVKISGQDGKVLANLVIGKEGGSAFTSYVRAADGKEAISAQGSLTFLFRKPDGWRDRGILEIPADRILQVQNEGSSSSLTLSRTSPTTWQVDGNPPREAIMARVNSLVSGLSILRAQDFANLASGQTLKDLGLDPPRQKVTVVEGDLATSVAQSKKTVLLFGTENDQGAIFAKRSDSEALFLVPVGVVRQLVPSVSEIAILPPAPVEEQLKQATPAPTPAATPAPTPAATPAPTPAATPAPTPAATPAPTPAATPAPTPAATPAPTPAATPAPTAAATPAPTAAATPAPTAAATPAPTPAATPAPTPAATPAPTPAATPAPTPAVQSDQTTGT